MDLTLKAGRWLWVDRGDSNRGGDAYDFLTGPAGESRSAARTELIERAGLSGRPERARRGPYARPADPLAGLEPPDLPTDLLDWTAAYRRLPGEPLWPEHDPRATPQGALCLDLLAGWFADGLRPLAEPGGPLAATVRAGYRARQRERFRKLP